MRCVYNDDKFSQKSIFLIKFQRRKEGKQWVNFLDQIIFTHYLNKNRGVFPCILGQLCYSRGMEFIDTISEQAKRIQKSTILSKFHPYNLILKRLDAHKSNLFQGSIEGMNLHELIHM